MSKNLVIVESPSKAKTLGRFLGKEYTVTSSMGHIRDLSEHSMGIDIQHNFVPEYEVSPDKKHLVSELKKMAKDADIIWLASDEDREGEAIAWHLQDELKLKADRTRRIAFHEITKNAILEAIQHPRTIDMNLVNAQQARRVLDRIVGFELSPVLWRKVKPSLSAGRVQSVAVRLVVDREREIQAFHSEASYRVQATFLTDGKKFTATLNHKFKSKKEAEEFLEHCKTSQFAIGSIEKHPQKRYPSPPFTTSTLQQEAARKLGFGVSQTMRVAQALYEAGKITYMRTDSVNLSTLALGTTKQEILAMAGAEYHHARQYTTQSKGAQEAHEAIRPTYMSDHTITGTAQEKKLYELIWKRTLACQMAEAEIEKTTVSIDINDSEWKFVANGEVVLFDGFLKVYMQSQDEDENEDENEGEDRLPQMQEGMQINNTEITATQQFTNPPARYNEASLVHKLEELGIGRPSTYAPTITTIQNRKYVERGDKASQERSINVLTLKNGIVKDTQKKEKYGSDKGKLIPTDMGQVVNDFLVEYFPSIIDYNFTAQVEGEFDTIAEGKEDWHKTLKSFYAGFHPTVEKTMKEAQKTTGERQLGTDPKSGKPVSVKIGKYGLIAQLGSTEADEKPQFAPLKHGQTLDGITLEEALDLFKLPRQLGELDGEQVTVGVGRFGPYIKYGKEYVSIPKGTDPLEITLEEAQQLVNEKKAADDNKIIKEFGDIQVLNGRYGPYIACGGVNYKIKKSVDPQGLTEEACREIMASQPEAGTKKRYFKRNK